jgi:hypothetical protein
MVLSSEPVVLFFRLVTILVPVGMYFLLLGLLNSRRTPQLLSGRQDFTLLLIAFAPVLVLPVLNVLRASLPVVAVAAAMTVVAAVLLAPRPGRWVIYNLPADRALEVVRKALEDIGVPFEECGGGFRIGQGHLPVQINAFPLLRNVSIRLIGAEKPLQRHFADALGRRLTTCRAETCPATVGLLLVAIAMMVAPLVLVAHRAGDIVRIFVDLLP